MEGAGPQPQLQVLAIGKQFRFRLEAQFGQQGDYLAD
jgi:hypothetical protein